MSRPLLSLSLDLDNQWSYLKTHGDPGWESFPSYLDPCVDVVLPRLERHGLRITFFVVGQDAALERNHGALRAIADAGHEIGNHSFHHEPWLHTRPREEIDGEIGRAEEAIAAATGQRPRGFRGPGFSFGREILEVLAARGYHYDATTFPTFLGPVARAYYFMRSRGLSAEEKEQRRGLFGRFRDGFQPLRPYRWPVGDGLIEIPVTTMPLLKVPIHLSYIVYLARFHRGLARLYLRTALALCRWTGVEPSILLHPLDFLGRDRVEGLGFFPGMDRTTDFKLELFERVLALLRRHHDIVPMAEHAAAAARDGLPRRPLAGSQRAG